MSEADYSTIGGGDFPPDAKTLVFRGISGTGCEYFVRSVRFIALTEGKEDDDRWILHFATARLSGKALRWHSMLDKDIRKDWDLLVAALLDEYPVDYDEDAASSSFKTHRPKAAEQNMVSASQPLSLEGPVLGLIRIVPSKGASHALYLSRDVTLTDSTASAMHVQFLRSEEPHEIGIIELDDNYGGKCRLPRFRLAVLADPTGFVICPNYYPSPPPIPGVKLRRLDTSPPAFQLSCWRLSSEKIL